MKKNEIILVSFEYFPISTAGMARHAKETIDRMIKNDKYKAVIAVPSKNKFSLPKKIDCIKCAFFNNKYLCYIEFTFKFYFKYRNQFKSSSFIFFSYLSYFLNPVLPDRFYIFSHDNARLVVNINYPLETFLDRNLRKTLYLFISYWERYVYFNAKNIFAVSSSIKQEIISNYLIKKEKIQIISNGLNRQIFKKINSIKRDCLKLIYVGKISPRKNINDLIEILNLLVNKHGQQFQLFIVGNGDKKYSQKIQNKVHCYNLSQHVHLIKYNSDKLLNILYEQAGIFVFSSLSEGMPLVLIEAMSKGLPIIAYDVIGVKDVVQHNKNGYLINVGDIGNFAKKILYLFSHKEIYKKYSINSLKRVDDFNWQVSIKKLISIIDYE